MAVGHAVPLTALPTLPIALDRPSLHNEAKSFPSAEVDGHRHEWDRHVDRFAVGELDALPPTPANYLTADAARIVHEHVERLLRARDAGDTPPPFPEADLVPLIDVTWADTGRTIFNNWLGLIYRLTDVRRGVPFMPTVDPDDPLGLATGQQ